MFNLVSPNNRPENLETRRQIWERYAKNVVKNCEVPFEVSIAKMLQLGNAGAKGAVLSHDKQQIIIDPIYLLSFDDLPFDLRPRGSTDPRLDDDFYLMTIMLHFSLKLNLDLDRDKLNLKSIGHTLKVALYIQENPLHAKSSLDVLIGHECGHLYHQHSKKSVYFTLVLIAVSIVACSILIGVAVSLSPVLSLAIPLVLGASYLSMKLMQRIAEYQADRFVGKYVDNAKEGGKLLLSSFEREKSNFEELSFRNKMSYIAYKIDQRIVYGSLERRIERYKKESSFLKAM